MMTSRQREACELLSPLLKGIGARYGYPEVAVSFARTAELRVRWARGWADDGFDFSVTYPDYLDDAPAGTLADLAGACMARTVGRGGFSVPASVRAFIEDEGFHLRRRPQYIARSRTLSSDRAGLEDVAERLSDMGLDIGDTVVMWDESLRMTPRVSPAMRVVGLPKALRLSQASPDARLLMAWAGVCRARAGLVPDEERLGREIARFPGRGALEASLRSLGLRLLRWGRTDAWAGTHPSTSRTRPCVPQAPSGPWARG